MEPQTQLSFHKWIYSEEDLYDVLGKIALFPGHRYRIELWGFKKHHPFEFRTVDFNIKPFMEHLLNADLMGLEVEVEVTINLF